jgi:predicted XRE-type DNA-binding protein
MEEWKDIPGMEGYYQCSNIGRVKSLDKLVSWTSKKGMCCYRQRKGRILSPSKYRYLQLHLSLDGKKIMAYVHRLVALTWIENPDNLREVDHINGNRYDNTVDNLRWVSPSTNMKSAYDNFQQKHGEHSCKAKLTTNQMFEIRDLYKNKQLSQEAIGKIYGISQSQVGNITRGVRWKRIIGGNNPGDL